MLSSVLDGLVLALLDMSAKDRNINATVTCIVPQTWNMGCSPYGITLGHSTP